MLLSMRNIATIDCVLLSMRGTRDTRAPAKGNCCADRLLIVPKSNSIKVIFFIFMVYSFSSRRITIRPVTICKSILYFIKALIIARAPVKGFDK